MGAVGLQVARNMGVGRVMSAEIPAPLVLAQGCEQVAAGLREAAELGDLEALQVSAAAIEAVAMRFRGSE